jgi:large subunit ribosomal protein L30
MGLLVVVNLHGMINVPHAAHKAMVELKVERRFSATLAKDDPTTVGMLRLCKDYLAWAPADKQLLTSLLKSRGKVSERKRLGEAELKTLGFKKYEDLASKLIEGELKLSSFPGLRPFFKLSPPRGGFKESTRRQAGERGVLGSNPKLPEIVERMI